MQVEQEVMKLYAIYCEHDNVRKLSLDRKLTESMMCWRWASWRLCMSSSMSLRLDLVVILCVTTQCSSAGQLFGHVVQQPQSLHSFSYAHWQEVLV